jgi:hypothetical protein
VDGLPEDLRSWWLEGGASVRPIVVAPASPRAVTECLVLLGAPTEMVMN